MVRKIVVPCSRAQPQDVLPEVGAALRVEPGRRLVEEQQPRPVHQAERDVEAAALAAGERPTLRSASGFEVERVEQLVAPRFRASRPAQAVRAALA